MSSAACISDASAITEVEELPSGWETARVTFTMRNGEKRTSIQIIDLQSKPPMQYWHDSMRTISTKCALLVFAIPIFAVLNMAFHAVRTVVLVVGTLARASCILWKQPTWERAEQLCCNFATDAAEITLRGGWDIVKLPFLAFGMQMCCLYGIFVPLNGRAMAGRAEKWIKGSEQAYDLRHCKDLAAPLTDLFTNKESKYCFFWAFCFQPVGSTIQSNIVSVKTLKPGKY